MYVLNTYWNDWKISFWFKLVLITSFSKEKLKELNLDTIHLIKQIVHIYNGLIV